MQNRKAWRKAAGVLFSLVIASSAIQAPVLAQQGGDAPGTAWIEQFDKDPGFSTVNSATAAAGGVYVTGSESHRDGYLRKFDQNGNELWVQYIGAARASASTMNRWLA